LFDQTPGDRQPQADAFLDGSSRPLDLPELLEDDPLILGSDADARIRYRNANRVSIFVAIDVVTLPLASTTRPQPQPAAVSPVSTIVASTALSNPLILIVDDELPARELLTNYLSPAYRVVTAESGAEAMANGSGF
jgi:hypothetical protein